jgi:hypothetical protein
MCRSFAALLLAGCLLSMASASFAAGAPERMSSNAGNVSVTRWGDENPVKEIAKSVCWGAAAGAVLGGAVMLAESSTNPEPLRWGVVIGAFGGLGAGVYFVALRPQPTSLLELRDGRLLPGAAPLAALEPVPGGARLVAVSLHF